MKLNKELYGIKKYAKCIYDSMKDHLTREMKFQKFLSDSCLFQNKDYSVWTGIYVDDILLVGNDNIFEETINFFPRRCNITTKERLN